MLRDTPESCGLPPIEDYRKDYTGAKAAKGEEEKIPFHRLFVDYVFRNKMLWLIAIANVFAYFVRYGISDWSPTYLQEVFGMDQDATSMAFALFEYAGIPGTILCGWISSRFFQGRCAPVNVIFMLIVAVGIVLYWEAAALAALTGIEVTTASGTTVEAAVDLEAGTATFTMPAEAVNISPVVEIEVQEACTFTLVNETTYTPVITNDEDYVKYGGNPKDNFVNTVDSETGTSTMTFEAGTVLYIGMSSGYPTPSGYVTVTGNTSGTVLIDHEQIIGGFSGHYVQFTMANESVTITITAE